jgi:hypothetical protein
LAFARRWFDERTVANVFEPLLADHQREWLDAAPAARLRVVMRTAAAFVIAMLAVAPRALFLTPAPASTTRRVIARVILSTTVLTVVGGLNFWREAWMAFAQHDINPAYRSAWFWALPSTVLVALPFAMGFAVDGVRRRSTPSAAERLAVLRASIIAVTLIVTLHGWVVPQTNQQYRLAVWGDRSPAPARGVRELTTLQLFESPWLAKADPIPRDEAIRREVHVRASFALLPIVVIWMRWRALSQPAPQWLLPAWLAVALTFVTYGVMRGNELALEKMLRLEPGGGAWLPLVLFVSIGLMRDRVVRRTAATA